MQMYREYHQRDRWNIFAKIFSAKPANRLFSITGC